MKQPIKCLEQTYRTLSNDNMGVCLKCLYAQEGCEPDARRYKCEGCDQRAVYGIEELLLMGQIQFIDNASEETLKW